MDYYSVLDIDSMATEAEIRNAYRHMAVKYHPDKNIHQRIDAEIRFKLILEAYQVLSSPSKRRKYDASRPRRQANATSADYNVDADEFGVSIHTMSIHDIPELQDAFVARVDFT